MTEEEKPDPAETDKGPFVLPRDLVQKLVSYLGTKPYQEVHQMLAELMRCHPHIRKE